MHTFSSRPGVWSAAVFGVSCLLLAALAPAAAEADAPGSAAPIDPGPVVSWAGSPDLQDVVRPPDWLDDAVAISASDAPGSYSSLALRADGTVVGWGLNRYGEVAVPDDLSDVVAIDSGAGFSIALRAGGSVAAWGTNDAGQLDVPEDLGPVTAVSAGGYFGYRGIGVPDAVCGFALALREDGTVVRWGRDRDGLGCGQIDARLDPPAGLSGVVAISAGSRQALALRADGTVVAWGNGVGPGLDGTPPAQWTDVVAVSAGSGNSLGLRSDGSVWAYGIWGEAGPPRVSDVAAISASNVDLFLRPDGTITAYPWASGVPTGTGHQAVSAGYDYGLAIAAGSAPEPSPSPSPSGSDGQVPLPTPSVSGQPTVAPEPTPSGSSQPTDPPPGQVPLPTVPELPPDQGDAPPSGPPPLGSADVQPEVDYNPAGVAEAFQYTARSDAGVDTYHLFLDRANEAETVIVGVYDDHDGQPGKLLSSGRSDDVVTGGWNAIPIRHLQIEQGRLYWLALLGPSETGIIRFRDLRHGDGGPTKLSAQHELTADTGLPTSWETGVDFANSPASAYLN